jgi:hypothetical protein
MRWMTPKSYDNCGAVITDHVDDTPLNVSTIVDTMLL